MSSSCAVRRLDSKIMEISAAPAAAGFQPGKDVNDAVFVNVLNLARYFRTTTAWCVTSDSTHDVFSTETVL